MDLYLDTEFTELHQHTTLISLALVTDTGQEFYAEFVDYDRSQVTPWITENVLSHLLLIRPSAAYLAKGYTAFYDNSDPALTLVQGYTCDVTHYLSTWLQELYYGLPRIEDKLHIWSDCLAYDWVLFCQLFGGAMSLPRYIDYIPYDLCTLLHVAEVDPDISREEFAGISLEGHVKHNALHDARVIKACVEMAQERIAVWRDE